jgi:predicted alpha/beta hydrolase family esterase
MPDSSTPTLEKWLPHLLKIVGTPDENCYFVGHSLGCITILKFLETLGENQKVGGTIFVAGFSQDLEYDGYKKELASFFKKPLDWENVKKHCKKFVTIHSSNDPWVNIKHLDIFLDKLGAEAIKLNGMKHFSGDDGINELPIVLDKLIKISD